MSFVSGNIFKRTERTVRLRFVESSSANRLNLELQVGRNGPVTMEIAAEGATLRPNGDSLFAFGFLPACELKYDLRIEGEVSGELLARAGEIFQLYARWYGYQRQPKVYAPERTSSHAAGAGRTLLFFSGGVDSCYSLVEARAQLHALVTIVGADLRPENREGAEWVAGLGRRFAQQFDLPSIIIHTAARRRFDRMVTWDHFHGPFLAGVAQMLAPEYARSLIASNYGGAGLTMPWGTHPDHEPRYSTAAMQVEHHLPQTRIVKIRRLWEAGLVKDLRVCIRPIGETNCGVCVKCIYLRFALQLLGGPTAVAQGAFARTDRDNFHMINQGSVEFWMGLRELAVERGNHALAERIRGVYEAFELRRTRPRPWLRLPRKAVVKRTKRRVRAWAGTLFRHYH